MRGGKSSRSAARAATFSLAKGRISPEPWLTDPQAMIPGAEMDFFVKDPQERVDVIAFLKQQSEK